MARRTRLSGVHTVGYEGRSVDELIALLHAAGVEVLVDVRQNAISRKPGFSKRRLGSALEQAGIQYRHLPQLGNPPDNRDAFRRGDGAVGRRRYVERLQAEGRASFDELLALAAERSVALLCFERDVAGCHRACIVDQALRERPDLVVEHL